MWVYIIVVITNRSKRAFKTVSQYVSQSKLEGLCVVQFWLLLSPLPRAHLHEFANFFFHLTFYSSPLGTQKETIPHLRDSNILYLTQ